MKHHKTLRRSFSVLLSLMLCLTMLPTIALAEEGGGISLEIAINEQNFPDDNFRQYVFDNIDKNTSGSLSNEEIAAVTSINCSNKGIKSLLGIGYFKALKTLDCSKNQLTALDISKNTSLEELWCYSNQLTELNVEKNTALTILWCYGNQLTELNVEQNTNLTKLACYDNQLTELNVEKNTALTYLHCANCGLTELNVKNNTKLTSLYCYTNRLT